MVLLIEPSYHIMMISRAGEPAATPLFRILAEPLIYLWSPEVDWMHLRYQNCKIVGMWPRPTL